MQVPSMDWGQFFFAKSWHTQPRRRRCLSSGILFFGTGNWKPKTINRPHSLQVKRTLFPVPFFSILGLDTLSYNARGGHGYGQQSHHNSGSPHYGPKKAKQPSFKVPSNKTLSQLDDERSVISTAFTPHILVQIPATWTQPSAVGQLPNMEPRKQAFQLAQVLSTRKQLELQLIEPNQNILKFKVSKIEDPDSEIIEQQQDNTILPNQSFASFEYVNSLRFELGTLGFSLIAQRG